MVNSSLVFSPQHERTIRYLKNEVTAIKNRMTSGGGGGGAGGAYDPAGTAAAAVVAHEGAYVHADIALNTAARTAIMANQNANYIFAGPAAAPAAAPTFRAMVEADLGTTLSPTFAGLDLTGLTDGYVPYVGAGGLANSPIGVGPTLALAKTELTYIDATAAGAFVDAASDLSAYAGASGATPYYIELVDGAGKKKTGYLGAAGAGETTSEVLTDGGLENWASATNLTSWTEGLSGGTVTRETVDLRPGTVGTSSCKIVSSTSSHVRQNITLVPNALYRLTLWYKTQSGKNFNIRLTNSGLNVYLQSNGTWGTPTGNIQVSNTSWTQYTIYFNAHASYTNYILYCNGYSSSGTYYVDDVSLVRITDPDSTGLHVYDGYNSTDRGWASTEAGFDPITIASYSIYSADRAKIYDSTGNIVSRFSEGGDLNLSGGLFINSIKVIGSQVVDADFANVPNSGDADTDDLIDKMRDALISHGLIAAA